MIPIDILTKENQAIIDAVARHEHTNRDYATLGMFSAAATLIGKSMHTSVETYTNYAQLWLVGVGYSSEAKSPALDFFYKPLFEREQRMMNEYNMKMAAYMENTMSRKNNEEKPQKPIYYHRIENNTTDEQIDQAVAQNDSITWYADELPMIFGLMGRYTKNGGSTVAEAKMLSYFDNRFSNTTRVSKGPELTLNPCLSIVGTIQPNKLEECLKGRTSSGMFQRFLFAWPELSEDNDEDYIMADPGEVERNRRAWEREVRRIEALPPTDIIWSRSGLDVYVAAKKEWRRMVRQTQVEDPDFAAILNKMIIHLCRIAIVAAVLAGKTIIDADVAGYAKRCCDQFVEYSTKTYQFLIGERKPSKPVLTRGDIYKGLLDRHPDKTQSDLANWLHITRQSVSSAIAEAKRSS